MEFGVGTGVEFFSSLRQANYYYVDKTSFLEKFLPSSSKMVSLFTRPRRFGKTLTLTMLAEFLDITKKNEETEEKPFGLFEGLAISRNKEVCDAWMHQYPVIFLTLKGIRAETWEEAYNSIRDLIAHVINSQHSCLLTSSKVVPGIRSVLKALAEYRADSTQVRGSLKTLSEALYAHYQKQVILLIDEYDVPFASAQNKEFYRRLADFLQVFLNEGLKTNPRLELGVLTGCLRLSKESIFTGLNNLNCYDITHHEYADAFGFTEDEVRTMLEVFGMADKMHEVREWYDGYHFGDREDIYCPWGITKYVRDHITKHNAEPEACWLNTSGNDIARNVLTRSKFRLEEDIETLISYPLRG